MPDAALRIIQISTADRLGGAERIAWNLFKAYRERGHRSKLLVGRRRTRDPDVQEIRNDAVGSAWSRFWWRTHHNLQPVYGRFPGSKQLCKLTHRLAAPKGWLNSRRGIEDFLYPGTAAFLDDGPPPDIIHCHNLHGNYFDLRKLPEISRAAPTILTLHDAWLLAGHCAHSFGCERWQTGCGQCPDLSIYPAIRRDATAMNWQRKAGLFAESRLFVAAPSRWLLDRARQSMLAPAIIDSRVIPNGVDLRVFKPADRQAVRASLNLPPDRFTLVFSACGTRSNPFKDYAALEAAIHRVAERSRRPTLFLAVGEAGETVRRKEVETRFVPPLVDPVEVARYYQAADVYVHASRADTFPNSVIEAMACGAPVVATAVGGIPEQVRPWPEEDATGLLTAPGDSAALAAAIERLSWDHALRRELGRNAVIEARERFDLSNQADAYMQWYRSIIETWHRDLAGSEVQPKEPASHCRSLTPVA